MREGIASEPSESGSKPKRSGIGHLVPEVVLTTEDGQITLRQLEILKAVSREASQNKAARKLRISTAVLNRQLRELERKAKVKLVRTTRRGSELTPDGKKLLRVLDAMCKRLTRQKELTVGCTQVSQRIAEHVCSKLAQKGKKARLVVAEDETNLILSNAGMLDIVFLDDPIIAYEYPKENRVHEVVTDELLHCERGKTYARLASGPQRIGFEMLQQEGKRFEIAAKVFSPEEALKSKHGLFVSRMLLTDRKIAAPTDCRLSRIPYSIYAVETTDHEDIHAFFDCMAPEQYNPVG